MENNVDIWIPSNRPQLSEISKKNVITISIKDI